MLGRIQTQLGISLEGVDLGDDSNQMESASSSDEHTDMTLDGVRTDPSPDGYNGSSDKNHPGRSALDFANLEMVDLNLVPMEDHNPTTTQQHMNMADPWGVPQMQSGYDWVSNPFPAGYSLS